MNYFFTNVASELLANLPSQSSSSINLADQMPNTIYFFPVTLDECSNVIKNLKVTKTGLNVTPIKLLKHISCKIIAPLTELINLSFRSGDFPNSLKLARLIPISKGGNPKEASNYRPISSLPFWSKIIERCIYNRLVSFTNKFSILSEAQFGFRRGTSTSDALIALTENIYNSLNERCHHISVLLDLKKAFDTVDRSILFKKLFSNGIRGAPLSLIQSFLTNRSQFLVNGNSRSSDMVIECGIPQGSILGPLLFLFYVNDLPKVSSSLQTILFADDTIVSLPHDNSPEATILLNTELEKVMKWTQYNRLTINIAKTQMVNFSNRTFDDRDENFIKLGVENLQFSNLCKYLGINMDHKLKFSNHIDGVAGKIARSTGIFYRIKHLLPLDARIKFYYAYVYPFLSYCVVVWGGTYSTHLECLRVQQKRLIRMIVDATRLSHTSEHFYELKILKFDDIYRYHTAIYLNKNLHKFPCNHSFGTRNRNMLVPTFHKLSQTQHAVSFMGPKIWNDLPENLKNINSTSKFKFSLRNYLLSKYR